MGKGGKTPRFTFEALPGFGVQATGRGDDLDRNQPIEPEIPRLVDLSHAAAADDGKELVLIEA